MDRVASEPESAELVIEARDVSVELARIEITRDIHYLTVDELLAEAIGFGGSNNFPAGADGYYFLGDNSATARDSRFFGPVPPANLHGVVRSIYWPPCRWRDVP